MSRTIPACLAEFVGTAALVFFGVLSIVLAHPSLAPGSVSLVSVALAHALILSVMVTAFMAISGAQFNPAVSIALVFAGKQSPARAALFIIVQLLAAACAAGLVQLLLTPEVANSREAGFLGRTSGVLTEQGKTGSLLLIEMILTFALMTSILVATVDARAHKLGGFTIGLTVAACILAAGPLTGASMNPARTFGPAICGRHWDMHWAYWAGPIAGALLATVCYRVFWEQPAKS